MTQTADVVVIGGGVSGTSIAWYLASRGIGVVLCERDGIASGISGTSGAIVRQHYSVPELARMAHYSLETFREFEARVGGPAGFTQTGYLVIVDADRRPALERNIGMHQSLGIETSFLNPSELQALIPAARLDGVAGAAWEPTAGYAEGRLTAETFARRATELGAKIMTETRVLDITHVGSRVTGVRTPVGPISAPIVVVAASTSGPALLQPLGLDFPISFQREWISFFRRPWELRDPHPAGVDLLISGHFRPEGSRATLFGGEVVGGSNVVADPAHYDRLISEGELARARRSLSERFPAMARAVALGGYGCVDDITPDWQPYLGPIRGWDGLLAAYGMSSHFFKHAPAVGRILSDVIADGSSSLIDVAVFRPERFADGAPISAAESNGLGQTL